ALTAVVELAASGKIKIDAVMGRSKSERRAPDAAPGYRNGHGTPRELALIGGTITVQRPRVRGREARFVSRVLPLFARRGRSFVHRALRV
ncbi:MAG: hypothetical protein ABIT38_06650, partial [Gemmatimonadaceae bacterium]